MLYSLYSCFVTFCSVRGFPHWICRCCSPSPTLISLSSYSDQVHRVLQQMLVFYQQICKCYETMTMRWCLWCSEASLWAQFPLFELLFMQVTSIRGHHLTIAWNNEPWSTQLTLCLFSLFVVFFFLKPSFTKKWRWVGFMNLFSQLLRCLNTLTMCILKQPQDWC